MANTIEEKHIRAHRACPKSVVKYLLTEAGWESDPDFRCSKSLVQGFVERYNLVMRVSHTNPQKRA